MDMVCLSCATYYYATNPWHRIIEFIGAAADEASWP